MKGARKSRRDIIQTVKESTGFRYADVEEIVFAYEDAILNAVRSGAGVCLHDFVNFQITAEKARYARKFAGGVSDRMIPARNRVKIKPGKLLRQCAEASRHEHEKMAEKGRK